jgi:hypothetical protein
MHRFYNSDHDVVGFKIAVRYTASMCLVERVGNLGTEFQHLIGRQRASTQTVTKRLAFQAFEDEISLPVMATNIVQNTDVRMGQLGNGARLAFESFPQLWIL